MTILNDRSDLRESTFTPTIHATPKWPDRHPRSKPRTCDLCGAEARLYAHGNRCDDHSPAAPRKAVAA